MTPGLLRIKGVQMTDGEVGRAEGSPYCSQSFTSSSKPPGVPYGSLSSSFSVLSGGRGEEGEVLSFFKNDI